ncbi:zonular occludens toxin domain-containing protein [Pseudomonas aeruginosa]
MKLDRLKSKWVEFETPEEWFNLPDGSVIVIDEAQRVFGNDGTRARPEKVTRFETHRHQGLDIHLITQHPSLLCTPVRKLVGKHINFIRPYGREKGIFRHEYEFCIDNPERRSNFKQAQEERVTLDKAYFGVYKSSTVHTHKPITPSYMKKIPLIIALMLIPIGVLVGLVVTAMRQGNEEKKRLWREAKRLKRQRVFCRVLEMLFRQPLGPPVDRNRPTNSLVICRPGSRSRGLGAAL